jgi:tRNA (cytidine/uridine-2'-O-)-methyltransferase
LPAALLGEYRATTVQLPMRPEVRSLNLASTVNTAVYEAVRQLGETFGDGCTAAQIGG